MRSLFRLQSVWYTVSAGYVPRPKHSRLPFCNVLSSEYVLYKSNFVTCNTAENKSIFYYYRLLELHHIQNEWTSTSWILPTPTPWTAWAAPSCTPWSSLPSSEYFPDLFAYFAENEAGAITKIDFGIFQQRSLLIMYLRKYCSSK